MGALPLMLIWDPLVSPKILELESSSALFRNENFSTRGHPRGAVPASVNFGPPHMSEIIRARMLKFYAHLARVKCCVLV